MITGNRPCIMRPPTGATDDASCANVAAVDDGYPLIMWCVDTIDWQHHDVATTCDTIRSKVKDGAIVLMHDMEASSAQASQIIIRTDCCRYESLQSVKWLLQEEAWYQVKFTIILIQRLDRHKSPLRFSQRQIRQLKHKCSNPRSRHKHQRQDNLKVKIRPRLTNCWICTRYHDGKYCCRRYRHYLFNKQFLWWQPLDYLSVGEMKQAANGRLIFLYSILPFFIICLFSYIWASALCSSFSVSLSGSSLHAYPIAAEIGISVFYLLL